MKSKNVLAAMFAVMMLASSFTGCGKQEEVVEEQPQTLPVEVEEKTEIDYYEPEEDTGLVPPIPLRLRGVSYEAVTVNTNVFHFNDESFSDFLNAANVTVDGENVKDIENSDFKFHGFALKSGNSVQMYAELIKDGELVETYSDTDKDSYEVKALYTSAELLGDSGNYFSCGTRVYTGLQKSEIETMNSKGYTSSFDANTFYYPDVEGWTMGLTYVDGTYEPAVPETTAEDSASPTDATSADAAIAETAESSDDNTPKMYLSELYLFKGDALVVDSNE